MRQTPAPAGPLAAAIRLALGVAAVAFGAAFLLVPATAPVALARMVGAGLLLSALGRDLVGNTAPRHLTAAMWVLVGLTGLVWPGITARQLAVLVGIALVGGGVVDGLAGARGPEGTDERVVTVLGGLTDVLFGVAALTWPTATVFVLVLVFGVRMVLFGLRLVAYSLGRRVPGDRPWPAATRIIGGLGTVAVAATAAVVAVAISSSGPADPGPFYATPDPLAETPGTVLRHEVIPGFTPAGTAHRVLYTSRDFDGRPAAASAIVVVPSDPVPPGGRPVLAFTHGTTGVARNCAPSLLGPSYATAMWGLEAFLDAGWVVTAPDYIGLGSEGVHPYLVGEAEAVSTLDAIRATIAMDPGSTSTTFAVAGESQGGQAALFTGEQAGTYAPELDLVGVAAVAPASDLRALFEANVGTTFGDILAAYALGAWSRVYDLDLDDVVDERARPVVDRIAGLCITGERETISLLPEAELLRLRFLTEAPWDVEPWSTLLDQNTPGHASTGAPILVVQGLDDPLVRPEVQRDFVARLCANGEVVDHREIPGVGHLGAGHAAEDLVADWLADRIDGEMVLTTC